MINEGLIDLREFQFGNEAVQSGALGTAVTPTAQIRHPGTKEDGSVITRPPENVGVIGGTTRAYKGMALARLALDEAPLTPEQLPYFLNASIRGMHRGEQDGAGSDYIRTYTQPINQASVKLAAITISFVAASDQIDDSGSGLGFIQVGDTIKISGASNGGNNDIFTVATAAAGSITVNETGIVVDESAGATVTIEVILCTQTVRAGSNARVWQATMGYFESFEISAEGGLETDAIMLTGNMVARQWAEHAAGFASIASPAVNELLFSKSQFYIDAVGGSIGTTEKAGTLASFTYAHDAGVRHLFAAHGQEYYYDVALRARPEITFEAGMMVDATCMAEFDNHLAGTPRLIQLKMTGAALGTSGTTYSNKHVILNMPGVWTSFPSEEEMEGAEKISAEFTVAYDPTAALAPSIIVVNELSSQT